MAETVNLINLFRDKMFRIPNYQRGYSWGERQLNELWDDITDIKRGADGKYINHYTGTIFLKAMSSSEIPKTERWMDGEYDFYSVVDGQQRLTSIVLLMNELIALAPEEGLGQDTREDLYKKFIYFTHKNGSLRCYKFLYDENNRAFLINKIFGDSSAILPPDPDNVYTRNLIFAKEFFSKKIKALREAGGVESLEELYRKLQTALIFDERKIEKDLDVQAVFETMNNRGKPLTTLEKLKNRLVYLCNRFLDRNEVLVLHSNINSAWSTIYTELARNPYVILDEDAFLSAFLSLYRKPESSTFSEQQAEKKVFEMFCNRASQYKKDVSESSENEEPVNYKKIDNFIGKLSEFSRDWYEINNPKSDMVKRITLMNGTKEVKIFLATLNSAKVQYEAKSQECLTLTEKALFRSSIPGLNVISNWDIANFARDIYEDPANLSRVADDLRERLQRPCDQQAVIAGFRWLFGYTNGAKGYHRWSGLKYLLFSYENYLKEKVYNEYSSNVSWKDFYDVSIEHIMPQSWEAHWAKEMEDYREGIVEDSKWRASVILVNSIGNLTIIKGAKNSELQNDSWKDKKARYKTGNFNEQQVAGYEKWDQYSILDRGELIIKFLEESISGLHFSQKELRDVLFSSEMFYPKKFRTNKAEIPVN